ncbi:MAG: glycosyltransferase [Dokdonella sp.]
MSTRIEWDGRTLCIFAEACASDRIAIEVDGIFFDEQPLAADDSALFRFPFSASGNDQWNVLPRAGRDGSPLLDEPISIYRNHPGLFAAITPPALASLKDANWLLPYATDAMAPEVVVVIPVYNAAEATQACIESVLKHTHGNWRLIIIDDASPDSAVLPVLARYCGRDGINVLRNEANLGFTTTANRGIRAAGDADVVLLNADTEVAAHWLTGLRRAACSRSDIGSVTAVSDNAGAFSVPELERENPWPPGWTHDDAARALWHDAGVAYPLLPTGNGFCMYLRRDVINAIGVLDEAAFPQGYGEENDWCQRAEAAGYLHLIAGNVLVHHLRTQSFGIERRESLGRAGMMVLRERWPNYENAVGATLFSFERRVLDWRVRRCYGAEAPPTTRTLRLIGAVPATPSTSTNDVWVAAIDGTDVVLLRPTDEGWNEIDRRIAEKAAIPASGMPHRQALWEWLQRYGFDAVQIIDRQSHPAMIGSQICRLGIPLHT